MIGAKREREEFWLRGKRGKRGERGKEGKGRILAKRERGKEEKKERGK